MRQFWGRFILLTSGVFPSTKFEEKLDPNGTYIFMANHFSYMDILSMIAQTGVFFRFLAKKELSDIPLFGILFRTIDISVDRKNMKKAHNAFVSADNALEHKESLCIFPEGTIGKRVPEMIRFKKGGFVLAVNHQVPIVPVTIVDNWKRLPDGGLTRGGTPGRARTIVHAPISTLGLSLDDIPDLQNRVRQIIQNQFNELNFVEN
jgi:1-acyl-sn-glycerol-3-phosphate acyltransferase